MDISATLESQGFAVVSPLLDMREVANLRAILDGIQTSGAVRSRREIYAIRSLLKVAPEVSSFVRSSKIQRLAEDALGGQAAAVRGTLLDKTPDANWLVPWHQDLTICVQERVDVPGFGPWTIKAGVHHVQPPVSVLEAMIAIRIHLDDCDENNGALRVIPGSHRTGRFTQQQVEKASSAHRAITCAVPCGSALIMKPLLLHASSAARRPSRRRVIHIDFSSTDLPSGLRWAND